MDLTHPIGEAGMSHGSRYLERVEHAVAGQVELVKVGAELRAIALAHRVAQDTAATVTQSPNQGAATHQQGAMCVCVHEHMCLHVSGREKACVYMGSVLVHVRVYECLCKCVFVVHIMLQALCDA